MQLNLAPRVIERPMGEATPPTKCCAARQRRGSVGFRSRAVNKVHGSMSVKGMIALVFSPIYLTLTLLSSDQYVAKRPTGTPKQDRRGKAGSQNEHCHHPPVTGSL